MKKALGITRKVDNLGRVCLLKEIRLSLGFTMDTPLEVLADNDGIYIRKYSVGCTICQGVEDLVEFGGTSVCRKCANDVLAVK